MGREWLVRSGSALGFNDLRAMAKNPIIGSIIQTRLNQVAGYCVPQVNQFAPGYVIRSIDGNNIDANAALQVSNWIYEAGIPGYGEDLLETLARKFIRDSLIMDQACAEIVFRRNGLPAYVVAIDSGTIRRLDASLQYATPENPDEPLYVQIIDDIIQAEYTGSQMIFGVRNPQTDIRTAGYGLSELEMLIRVITSMFNTEKYNSGQLMQGGTQKGVLVVRGDADNVQFETFKRDFREAVRNAANFWRPPVLKISKDAAVDWVTLDRANRDMEYGRLFDFLVKQACGIYAMDPNEINWSVGAAGSTTTFESRSDVKQAASRNRGLRPLLNFFANQLNPALIQKLDPRFRIEFVGIDLDRRADAEVSRIEVTSFKTLNELRADKGLKNVQGGDIVLNAQYLQALGIAGTAGALPGQIPDDTTDASIPGIDPPLNVADDRSWVT
jgi:hypothetical protein